jgi:hypothetical protein
MLSDIAKANGVELTINEAARAHPELTELPAFPLKGLFVKSVVYLGTSNTTGSFRDTNAGTAAITEQSEERMFQCYTAEPRIEVDRSEADRYENGPANWIGGKGTRALDMEMLAWCRQMYYGASNNAKGFPGLMNLHDTANMVIDATGTTADTGSSLWLVRECRDMEDDGLCWRFGQDGKMAFDPVRIESIIDPNDSTKRFTGYVTSFMAYPGVQVRSLRSVVRIKNLTADNGKGLTDALINRALALFPAGKGPTKAFATQRSVQQWQSSRTATSPTGQPAPWPTSIVGIDGQLIPVKVTEALTNTEAIA